MNSCYLIVFLKFISDGFSFNVTFNKASNIGFIKLIVGYLFYSKILVAISIYYRMSISSSISSQSFLFNVKYSCWFFRLELFWKSESYSNASSAYLFFYKDYSMKRIEFHLVFTSILGL